MDLPHRESEDESRSVLNSALLSVLDQVSLLSSDWPEDQVCSHRKDRSVSAEHIHGM